MIAITIIYWFIPSNDSHIFPTLARSSSLATSLYFSSVLSCKKTSERKLIFYVFFLFLVSQERKKTLENQIRTQEQKENKQIHWIMSQFLFIFCSMLHILCLRCCSQFTRPISWLTPQMLKSFHGLYFYEFWS